MTIHSVEISMARHHTNMRVLALVLGAAGGDWAEVKDRYLLCCVVLCWVWFGAHGIPAMWVLWATWPPHLDLWTLSLCEPSQMIILLLSGRESSFYISDFELMLSERRLTQGNFWRDTWAVRGSNLAVTCQLCDGLSSKCQTTLLCHGG